MLGAWGGLFRTTGVSRLISSHICRKDGGGGEEGERKRERDFTVKRKAKATMPLKHEAKKIWLLL